MKIRNILITMLIAVFAFATCSCGAGNETAEENVANPFVEVESSDALCEATGMSLDAPEGASDAVYSYCKNDDESISFAQVTFKYDGDNYCYRCQDSGDLTSLEPDMDGKIGDDLAAEVSDPVEIGAALAGLNYKWKAAGGTDIGERYAVYALNKGDAGFVAWLDVAPGFLYSLGMDDHADQPKLIDTANLVFVSMQGEA